MLDASTKPQVGVDRRGQRADDGEPTSTPPRAGEPALTAQSSIRAPSLAVRAVAPLAALLYPAIIWCGVRSSPIVLALSLGVPLLALAVGHHIAPADGFPRARRVAHLAVAAPPLFSLLGGWLDFQHALPFHGLTVWIAVWSAALVAVAIERPCPASPAAPSRHLAMAHGISAAVITLFAAAHVFNHLAGLFGGETHIAVMSVLRTIYRNALVEPVLLAVVAFQVATGTVLLWRKLTRANGWFDTLQTATGAYMLLFLLSHVSAALRARYLRGTDTNWAWLSGGELLTDPWSARLAPYYFLAVIAFGVHGACGLRKVALGHGASPVLGARLVALGAAVSTVVSALIFAGLVRA
ncbi:MAG: hypothetical protein HOV81_19605 [Kofleriaceae bacterium]|nr:hypothetical protein [Kofleriaceae bacterium]